MFTKYTTIFITSLFMFGCGNGNYTPPKASVFFKTQNYVYDKNQNGEVIIKDLRQNLMFVNDTKRCKALHEGLDALTVSQNFCQNITLFGYNDWRIPTLKEIQNFSQGMQDEGLVPYFTFAQCKRTVGLEDGKLEMINTHNVKPNFAKVKFKLPAGLRCVRNMQ